MDGDVELARLQVPERDVDSRQRGHEDGAAAVEAQAVDRLPDVLDVVGFVAGDAGGHLFEGAFDGLDVAFEGRFAPAGGTGRVGEFQEEPARSDAEGFDGFDLGHCESSGQGLFRDWGSERIEEDWLADVKRHNVWEMESDSLGVKREKDKYGIDWKLPFKTVIGN